MGRYRSVMLLGVAIVIALITSLLVYNSLQRKGRGQEAVIQTQAVVVAAVDLSWGTKLTMNMVKKVDFLKGSLSGGYFSDPSSLVGRVLIFPVKANEPIFESRLAPVDINMGGVAAVITPQKRAVAVKVDKVIGVSGFIYPGNRVDILVTLATGRTVAPMTKTILENILVLAVGSETKEKKGSGEKSSPTDVITLEVTPEEAERLALAATEGRLQLALRNFSDNEDSKTHGTTLFNLLGSYYHGPSLGTKSIARREVETKKEVEIKKEVEEKPVSQLPLTPPVVMKTEEKRPSVFTVELIKGSKVTEVKFEGSEE
jgi:pilus assembly protein CpaB